MTKESLLMWLREAFSAYPPEEVEERIRFYEEMIDDRMEDGLTEEEAVASLGSLEEVIAKMAAEMPPLKKKKAMRLRWWEILLLVLGFPLWFRGRKDFLHFLHKVANLFFRTDITLRQKLIVGIFHRDLTDFQIRRQRPLGREFLPREKLSGLDILSDAPV